MGKGVLGSVHWIKKMEDSQFCLMATTNHQQKTCKLAIQATVRHPAIKIAARSACRSRVHLAIGRAEPQPTLLILQNRQDEGIAQPILGGVIGHGPTVVFPERKAASLISHPPFAAVVPLNF